MDSPRTTSRPRRITSTGSGSPPSVWTTTPPGSPTWLGSLMTLGNQPTICSRTTCSPRPEDSDRRRLRLRRADARRHGRDFAGRPKLLLPVCFRAPQLLWWAPISDGQLAIAAQSLAGLRRAASPGHCFHREIRSRHDGDVNWFGTAMPLVSKWPAKFELNGFLFSLPERTTVCSVVICS